MNFWKQKRWPMPNCLILAFFYWLPGNHFLPSNASFRKVNIFPYHPDKTNPYREVRTESHGCWNLRFEIWDLRFWKSAICNLKFWSPVIFRPHLTMSLACAVRPLCYMHVACQYSHCFRKFLNGWHLFDEFHAVFMGEKIFQESTYLPSGCRQTSENMMIFVKISDTFLF